MLRLLAPVACAAQTSVEQQLQAAVEFLASELGDELAIDPTYELRPSGPLDALRRAVGAADVPVGDAAFARNCSSLRHTLSVPDSANAQLRIPEGCTELRTPVLAFSYWREDGALSIDATGWSWIYDFTFVATVDGDLNVEVERFARMIIG